MTLVSLIREVLNDPPLNNCADNGTSCAFCYAQWDGVRAWQGGKGIEHAPDCWLIRAAAAISQEPPEQKGDA